MAKKTKKKQVVSPTRWRSTRRAMLRNSVLAALLAPVAKYWDDMVEAQAMVGRRNLILVFLPNGKVASNDYILGDGDAFSLAYGYEPYMAFRDDMILFDEYGFQSFIREEYTGDHGGHVAPGGVMYSGEVPHAVDGAGRAGMAPSLDQIVAWDLLEKGHITDPLRKSLNIKMTGSSFRLPAVFTGTPADYALGATYTRALDPVSQHNQPQDGFAQMFRDFVDMSGSSLADLQRFGRSILDVPAQEIGRIQSTLPSDGRAILEEHLTSIRELERSFMDDGTVIDPARVPDEPGRMDTAPPNHVDVWQQWVRIIDASLRLQRTHVVTIQFGGVASRFQIPELGLGFVGEMGDSNSGSDHHSYTHWDESNVPHFMDWYAQRVAELLGALKGDGDAVPDLLRDSALMVGMEFGRNHNASDMPVMLFGQLGDTLRTGQRLRYGNELDSYHKHTGTLLALAHGMGTTGLTHIGRNRPQYQRGVATELLR